MLGFLDTFISSARSLFEWSLLRKGNKLRERRRFEGRRPRMDVFEIIGVRRNVRKYRPEPISDEKLEMILEAARVAPSAGNRQPWRFVLVQDADRKKTGRSGE